MASLAQAAAFAIPSETQAQNFLIYWDRTPRDHGLLAKLTSGEKVTWGHINSLLQSSDNDGEAPVPELARLGQCTERTIYNRLRGIKEKGALYSITLPGKPSKYYLNFEYRGAKRTTPTPENIFRGPSSLIDTEKTNSSDVVPDEAPAAAPVPVQSPVAEALITRHVTPWRARQLARRHKEPVAMALIQAVDRIVSRGRIDNPPGLYVAALLNPEAYASPPAAARLPDRPQVRPEVEKWLEEECERLKEEEEEMRHERSNH